MADTYAFALGGALLLALTLSPVLCLLLLQQPQAGAGQLPGPLAQGGYLRQLELLPEPPLADAGGRSVLAGRSPRLCACRTWAASSCRSWRRATSRSAAPSRSTSRWTRSADKRAQSPRRSCASIPRWSRSCRRSAGPTTAPTRPASTTSRSSCRCRPQKEWPAVEPDRLAALSGDAAAHQGRADRAR